MPLQPAGFSPLSPPVQQWQLSSQLHQRNGLLMDEMDA